MKSSSPLRDLPALCPARLPARRRSVGRHPPGPEERPRAFARVVEADRLPHFTPYSLRHNFASLLPTAGVDVRGSARAVREAAPGAPFRETRHRYPIRAWQS
jgi:integrase